MQFDEAYKDRILHAVEALNHLIRDGFRAGLIVEYRVEDNPDQGRIIKDLKLFRVFSRPTESDPASQT